MKKFIQSKPAQPLIYAICIVIGLVGGKKLYQDQSYQLGFSNAETSKGKIHDILNKIDKNYVDTIDFKSLEEESIVKIVKSLDPHSYYLTLEDMVGEDEKLNGNFSGIGVEFKIIDDTIVVLQPIKGGPSFKADILIGDKIIAVNHTNFTGDSITSALAMKYLKGVKGSEITVDFLRDKKTISKEITRAEIPLNSIDVFTVLKNEVGYIKIARFSKRTNSEFEDAVDELLSHNIKSLIIDVRDNPGGLMGSVIKICESFLSKDKLIVSTKGRTESNEDFSTSKGKLADYPLYVLINENSASASEILAGAVQDHDRGIIIGRRSFGKGLVQRPFSLKDGSALRLTIARYYTPSGRCIQRSYEQGNEEYYKESISRLVKGELNSADSIPLPDSLKFYTSKGKLVYGGGGIIPDEFIATDTSALSNIAREIFKGQEIDRFFLSHLNLWSEIMSNTDLSGSYKAFIKNDFLWNKFESFLINRASFSIKSAELRELKEKVLPLLLGRILRMKFQDLGQYYYNLKNDPEIAKALELHFKSLNSQ